jgi:DNA-binding response OmpR family regulator
MPQTIMIVDDETDIRDLVRRVLTSEGYEVLEAGNGQELFHVLETSRPDLILMDVMMPAMDGYELCSRLKSNAAYRSIPVVILTVLATAASLRKGLDAGAAAYLTKPFDPSVLGEKIRALLDQPAE